MDKIEQARRLKGRVLERLVKNVLDDMGLPFTHTCDMGYLNKKGEKYADHINHECVIEDKNWFCEHYKIDANIFYKQIQNRFEQGKEKILVISEPSWTAHAKALININNIHVITLNMDPGKDYATSYWKLRDSFIDLFTRLDLYCHILYGNGKKYRLSDAVHARDIEEMWIREEVLHNERYLLDHLKYIGMIT